MKVKEPYVILEHPADLGIEAHGKSLSEAFQNAAAGMMSVIIDPSSVDASDERHVKLEATDRDQLLVKWLSEILYLYDGQRFVGKEFVVKLLNDANLEALIRGEPFSPQRHRTRQDVKAVTYHQLLVQEDEQGAVVRVYLDI